MDNIKQCNCKHAYQDKKYGTGMRVFNKYMKGLRCTVCNQEKVESTKK